jgi:hypothetical protein
MDLSVRTHQTYAIVYSIQVHISYFEAAMDSFWVLGEYGEYRDKILTGGRPSYLVSGLIPAQLRPELGKMLEGDALCGKQAVVGTSQ